MRITLTLLILTATLACPALQERVPISEPVDVKAEIERFLATEDPAEEAKILDRLKQNDVSHDAVKSVLRQKHPGKGGVAGLQLGLHEDHNEKKYSYALFVPEPPSPEATLPLIVVLHGMGGNGDNTIQPWVERLAKEFIVLCPSYPMGAWWTRNAESLVLKLIRKVQSGHPVDPDRIFLAGLSNGAIGTYMIGMFHPDAFAGIVPIAGAITPRYMHVLVNLKNTPVYMIQGAHDPIFPIQLSRRIDKILSDMKYPAVYREHEERGLAHGGHFLPEAEVPPLVQWLQQQKRRPDPQAVRMTREANHLGRIHWVRLVKGVKMAALDLPGPDQRSTRIRDGKIATLFAVNKGNNEIEIMGKNLLEYEVYLNSDTVDFERPVLISTQMILEQKDKLVPGEKEINFHGMVEPDLEILLRGFKEHRDPALLFDAKVTISLEKVLTLASRS